MYFGRRKYGLKCHNVSFKSADSVATNTDEDGPTSREKYPGLVATTRLETSPSSP